MPNLLELRKTDSSGLLIPDLAELLCCIALRDSSYWRIAAEERELIDELSLRFERNPLQTEEVARRGQ
jgi:hypothetical protein